MLQLSLEGLEEPEDEEEDDDDAFDEADDFEESVVFDDEDEDLESLEDDGRPLLSSLESDLLVFFGGILGEFQWKTEMMDEVPSDVSVTLSLCPQAQGV